MGSHILWVDDEIENLQSHIIFLQEKGYEVTPVSNGEDAIDLIRQQPFDIVFLDEQMPGTDGLTALGEIKNLRPFLPVVMITKSEEESIMDEAIGGKISDYLIKPVHPKQIVLTVKRILDHNRLRAVKSAESYIKSFNELSRVIEEDPGWEQWIDIYQKLVQWDIELEKDDEGLRQVLHDQYEQANLEFGRFIEQRYEGWVQGEDEDAPVLSPDLFSSYLKPLINEQRPTLFFLIDCMRYDQWLVLESLLQDHFHIQTDFYCSILPTATPYARNALFSGLYPLDIEHNYPDLWQGDDDSESSLNRYEETLFKALCKRHGFRFTPFYRKILKSKDSNQISRKLNHYLRKPLSAFVFNFVDTLVHTRSDSTVLKEIAPDAAAFRSLTQSWFRHSPLLSILKSLSAHDVNVVISSDHGSIRALRDTLVKADRAASTGLRAKHGRQLECDEDAAIRVADPYRFKLPRASAGVDYIFAKQDYYFIYPTQYHHYQQKYRDMFLHGGASMQEMILPVAQLTPKSYVTARHDNKKDS